MHVPSLFNSVYVIIAAVCLHVFSMGTSVTWTSPVLPKLQNHTDNFFDKSITEDQASWIVSWYAVGQAIGSPIFAFLTCVIGRKSCLLVATPPLIISYIMLSFANSLEFYYVARFLAGITATGTSVLFNLYLSEIVRTSQRASVAGFAASIMILGFVYSYAVGPYVSLQTFNITLIVPPTLFMVIFYIVGVETPQYYVMKGNEKMVREVLLKLRDKNDNIEEEIIEIEDKINENKKKKLHEILRLRSTKIGFFVAFGLLFFQQLTGIYCIQFYSQQIFEMTGSSIPPEICAIVIGLLQFISGFITSFVMERFPRKTLLYFSAAGMAVSDLPLGIYCYLREHGTDMRSWSFLPMLTMSLFVLTYNIASGPLTYIIPSEIFPSACKGFGVAVVGFVNSVFTFFMAKYFKSLVHAIGLGQMFLIFSIFCLISIPFVKFFVLETRGKSFEQIQDELTKRKPNM